MLLPNLQCFLSRELFKDEVRKLGIAMGIGKLAHIPTLQSTFSLPGNGVKHFCQMKRLCGDIHSQVQASQLGEGANIEELQYCD